MARALCATHASTARPPWAWKHLGRFPQVFQDVDEVDQDGDRHSALACFGGDAVDLVVVPVHEGDPGAGVARVPAPGLVEDLPDDTGRILHHACRQPLVGCGWCGCLPGAVFGAGGHDVIGAPAARLRLRFSPAESLLASFGDAAAAVAVPGRNASGRMTTPFPSQESTRTSLPVPGGGWQVV